MKKKLLSIFLLMVVMSFSVFSKPTISWGMSSKKLKKIVTIEQSYENSFCEILLLPKDSIFENEYDEYLLFSRDIGLIAKLHNSNQPFEDYVNSVTPWHYKSEKYDYLPIKRVIRNSKNISAKEYFFEKKEYFKNFPNENSFETIILLYGLSDDIMECGIENGSKRSQSIFINMNGIAYQMDIYYSKLDKILDEENFKYSKFQEDYSAQINSILDSFEHYIQSNLREKFELKYKNKHGPFGIVWGMNKSEVFCIGELGSTETGLAFNIDEYEKYYFYENDYLNIQEIKPIKKNDKIFKYIGIFDKNQNLIQLVCISYATLVGGYKNLYKQDEEANLNYDDMKRTISSIYGNGNEIKNCGEECVQWKDYSGQSIELLQNSYSHTDFFGREGLVKYVWLVYSSPEYNSAIEKIKNTIDEKELKKQQELQEKEKVQNSYF